MKTPDECRNMQDIREEIDALDHKVIALLGQRFGYVRAAAKFKTSENSVRARERFASMLEQRRQWAGQAGLSADAVEKMYRDLVTYFIEEEMQRFKNGEDKT